MDIEIIVRIALTVVVKLYQKREIELSDTLPMNEKINANLKKGIVPSRVELDDLLYQRAELLMVDHFKEWVMDNNPEFDKVIEDQIYLPQEKKVISKRLRKLAKQLER
ncbi:MULTISPECIES: hypothetical protein [Bacillus cereus group]|jgi:hypothetical protein|uniref:hypothetical protein n=1 Tax=Bacillus cereus group TaxID=86661 RepID=UPI001F28003B|nr:hypothetical protein [Bacillus cereus]MDA1521495.1 hypothetical protein [Bacillus cereus]BCC09531.1 hypothetical protein BCM0060_p2197 [Bacillus cereus]BCC16520.1 hypothetical protein BCM0075_1290 [Bacillus cereus]BCC50573.1 hypothetical protein BCJMU02_p2167 [Bacillus cereus]BCD08964.1 hypothetical protein BC30052_p2246 [Bacillus cereus]